MFTFIFRLDEEILLQRLFSLLYKGQNKTGILCEDNFRMKRIIEVLRSPL